MIRRSAALLLLAAAMAACGGDPDEEMARQAAAIVAAVERSSSGAHPAEPEALCVSVMGQDGSLEGDDPPGALLAALEDAGWPAVPQSTCGPEEWYMESGEPFTVTADGTPALQAWVREPDPERPGRIAAGTLPWPLQEAEWDCAARRVEGGWVFEDCQMDTFN